MKRIVTTNLLLWCLLTTLVAQTGKGLITYAQNDVPKFIEFDEKFPANGTDPLQVLAVNLNLSSNNNYVKISETVDKLGRKHEKYQQYYQKIKIEFCTYSVHYSLTNNIIALSGDYAPIDNLTIIPVLSEQDALKQAIVFTNDTSSTNQNIAGELLICKNFIDSTNTYHLAYKFYISDVAKYVYVNAINGTILCDYSTIIGGVGDACSRYSGLVNNTNSIMKTEQPNGIGTNYILNDYSRGQGIFTYDNGCTTISIDQNTKLITSGIDFVDADNDWCDAGVWDNTNPAMDNAALDVHWGLQRIYDYWLTVHNRNSYDNLGGRINAYVHVNGDNFNTPTTGKFALWSPFVQGSLHQTAILLGNGDNCFFPISNPDEPWTSLDILTHEFAHGVAISAFDITPINGTETAAISEGMSDIWGAVVENWVDNIMNLNNPLDIDKNTWLFGEEVRGGGIRSLQDPTASPFFDADAYMQPGWSSMINHARGCVMSKWFYLISEGITGTATNGNGNTYGPIQPIGIEKAADILYLAMAAYFTSTIDFADARQATLQAAKDLYGVCSQEAAIVAEAWNAVDVSVNYPTAVIACGVNDNGLYDNSGHNFEIATGNPPDGIIYSDEFLCNGSVTVLNNASAVFKASNKILLGSGFKAEKGSNFKAYIFECTSGGNYRTSGNGSNSNENDVKEKTTNLNQTTVSIYPNPNSGIFYVEIADKDGNTLMEVYDIMGKKIASRVVVTNKTEIDISTKPKGIYLVKVANGNTVVTQKIVVQ